MKNITILLILLLTTLGAKSSDYSVIIDKPFNNELFDITEDYNRDVSAVGFTNSYESNIHTQGRTYTDAFEYLRSAVNENGSKIHLIKLDKNAKVTIDKIINLPKFNKAVSVLKTPNNGYYIGGNRDDGSLVVLKTDSNGNIIFNKTFGMKNQDKISRLIKLKDGGVLAVGSSMTSREGVDNLFKSGLGKNDIYITKLSNDGRELWSKKYGTPDDDRGVDAVEADDGSIIVLSTTSYDAKKNVVTMRITENGEKVWLKSYKFDSKTTPYKIIKLKDNNFLISLSQNNTMDNEQIRLIKFDLYNNTIIDKEISTTYSSALKDIKEYSNGNLVGVGYVKDGSNTDGLVIELDEKLNLKCQEHFGAENYDLFNGLNILHNNEVAVAGVNTDENFQESNSWILKLNNDCTIAQKAIVTIDFYEELLKLFKEEIYNKRLVIKKDLSIDFTYSSLYFKVSKYNLTDEQKDFLDKFSKKLIPFLKKHKNLINTLEVNGHSSSEWANKEFAKSYLLNEKLSMNRSYSTLSHIFNTQNKATQSWLTKVLKGSGLSYSKMVVRNNREDKEKSRRVSFKVILNENY